MTMQISSQVGSTTPRASAPPAPPKTLVEKIVDQTVLSANYAGSTLSGGVGGIGAFGRSVVGASATTAASAVKNLWQAETVGPNLKILGTLAAIPALAVGAALSLPVSLVAGMIHGAHEVDSSKPREFTIGAAGMEGYSKTRAGWQKATASLKEDLADFGSRKLEKGEKPVDIPLIKTAKTLAVGVAAAVVGGVAGAICAVVGTGRQVATGLAKAFTDKNLNLPGKVIAGAGAVLGGAIQGTAFGAGTAVSILGRGLSETWTKDSVVQGFGSVVGHAVASVKAAAAPEATLLQEAPTQQA